MCIQKATGFFRSLFAFSTLVSIFTSLNGVSCELTADCSISGHRYCITVVNQTK